MYSVNRDIAVDQLRRVHTSTYNAAAKGERGSAYQIVLADNEMGIGKTAFANSYIRRCIADLTHAAGALPPRDCFEGWPCRSRTIRVMLKPGDMATINQWERVEDPMAKAVNAALAEAVIKHLNLVDGVEVPSYLRPPISSDYTDVVESIVKHLGPVFIVVDEIDASFESDEMDEEKEDSHEQFLLICSTSLQRWMHVRGVFFLMMGPASFLADVEPHNSRALKFQHLSF